AAEAACRGLGVGVRVLRAGSVPSLPAEREMLARLLERESLLAGAAILLEGDGVDNAPSPAVCAALVGTLQAAVLVSSPEPLPAGARPYVSIPIPRATSSEQRRAWVSALGESAKKVGDEIDRVVRRFDIDPVGIFDISRAAKLADNGNGALA